MISGSPNANAFSLKYFEVLLLPFLRLFWLVDKLVGRRSTTIRGYFSVSDSFKLAVGEEAEDEGVYVIGAADNGDSILELPKGAVGRQVVSILYGHKEHHTKSDREVDAEEVVHGEHLEAELALCHEQENCEQYPKESL